MTHLLTTESERSRLELASNTTKTLVCQSRLSAPKINKPRPKNTEFAGVESRVNDDLSVKAKVDQKGKVTSSLQYTLDNRVSFLTTVQVNNPNKPLDLKKIIPLPLGYQISINV